MAGGNELNTDWRCYPFRLVADDSRLEFPAAEGEHADQESDTWFIAGELAGATGRSFAFLTIFNKNRPGGTVVADFYTMSLFDCDTGAYGTYTDYDMPPLSMRSGARPKLSAAAGHLELRYESGAGMVAWTTCRDGDGSLQPYTYRVRLLGVDQEGQSMELDLTDNVHAEVGKIEQLSNIGSYHDRDFLADVFIKNVSRCDATELSVARMYGVR